MAKKQSTARAGQPRGSKAVRDLRLALGLGLGAADWQAFLWHARNGFADYERANHMEPDFALRLEDVPDAWYASPEALGYVAVRVLNEGKASLAAPVARFFLRICDPGPARVLGPPGIGLAWLHLARQGQALPLEPARLAHLALSRPKDFFQGVAAEELLPLCRLILEGRGTIEAWDLHALLAALESARLPGRAPYRVCNDLMAADWFPTDVKREFCRGLLECDPEAGRLRQRGQAILDSLRADAEQVFRIPRMWLEVCQGGLRVMLPGLQRHAARALVEDCGEPLPDVIAEFFLRRDSDPQSAEAVSQGVLDLIGLRAEELGPETVRRLLRRAIAGGSAPLRQAAYRVGADQFGLDFARPALNDSARLVRDWAGKLLARSARPKDRSPRTKGRTPPPSEGGAAEP